MVLATTSLRKSTCRMALLLTFATMLTPATCEASFSAFAALFVELDADAEASRGRLGQVEIVAPLAADFEDELPPQPLAQPFAVVLSANLFPGVDYTDWAMCYAVFAHNATASNSLLAAAGGGGGCGSGGVGGGASDDARTTAASVNALWPRPTPALPPYCVSFRVVGNSVQFAPLSEPIPPLFDGFSAAGPHMAVAWFQTIAVPAVKWGAVLRGFTVERPLPKHGDGRAHVLASDSGADEFEDDVWIVDGELRVSKNPTTHAFFKTTPTVCGALVEPRDAPLAVANALRHVLARLPMVRPLHFFHAKGFLDSCAAANNNGSDGGGDGGDSSWGLDNGGGGGNTGGDGGVRTASSSSTNGSSASSSHRSSIATRTIPTPPLASTDANKQQGWAFALGPLSFAWKNKAAAGAAAPAVVAAPAVASSYETAARVWQRRSTPPHAPEAAEASDPPAAADAAVSAARAYLCGLVASEAVVAHPLTVSSLSAAERGDFLKSRVFWSRLDGSGKVLLFDADSPTASGGCNQPPPLGGAEATGAIAAAARGGNSSGNSSRGNGDADAVALAKASAWPLQASSPPRLVRDFAAKFDFVEAPATAERSAAEASGGGSGGLRDSGGGFGGKWSLRDVKLVGGCAAEYGHLVGGEGEAHFFERCVRARGGKVANATEHTRFRAAVCPRGL